MARSWLARPWRGARRLARNVHRPRPNLQWPRRTVRLRLTALYGGLFLVSGAALLAITYGVITARPINASFGVEQSGTLDFRAVPIDPARLNAYARCMREHGVTDYPLPRFAAGGRAVEFVSRGELTGGAQLVRAASTCQKTTGVPSGMALPGSPGALKMIASATSPVAISEQLPTPEEKVHWLVVSAIALGLMALASVGLGWLMAGRALRPVRTMTAKARHISEDNLDARLALQGPDDELKDLADTFDGMLGRLEGAFDAQRRFVANASHELRTPLAMMRTSLDVALGKQDPPQEVRVLAGKLEEGLDQAEKLLDNLLVLARSQRGTMGPPELVSLGALAGAALDADQPDVLRLGLSVTQTTSWAGEVMGNPVLLDRMVANVVDNAVRHNVSGGWVRVVTDGDARRSRLLVENGGPVISPGKLARLGEPFARPGTERVATNDGSGLGLSIAKAVAAAHGGSLVLDAPAQGGLRVVVELPAQAHQ